jgi:hypothetical protein
VDWPFERPFALDLIATIRLISAILLLATAAGW